MFIAAGILAVGAGVIGVASHSDHSDYSDYYSDYAERERKRKKAELNAKEQELETLKQQLKNECDELYKTIQEEADALAPEGNVNVERFNLASKNDQANLKRYISNKLNESLVDDKNELQEINETLKRINEIQLQAKKSLEEK